MKLPESEAETRAWLKQWEPLASKIAWSFRYKLRPLHGIEDLMAIAMAALWTATKTYDLNNAAGAGFATYAKRVVLNSMLNELKHLKTSNRQIFTKCQSLSLEFPDGSPVVEPRSPELDAEAELAAKQAAAALQAAMGKLTSQQRAIIQERFLNRREPAFMEIGKSRGVSRQRIEQIQNEALKRMRAMLQHEQVSL